MKKTVVKTIIMGLFSVAMLFTACKPVVGTNNNDDVNTALPTIPSEGSGNVDSNNADSNITYESYGSPVYVEATERGIEFKYASVIAKAHVCITEMNSGIALNAEISEESIQYVWEYPFVEKGKSYKFHFEMYTNDYAAKLIDSYFIITAKGGLGEYKVENADKVKTCFSNDSKIISRSTIPEFTTNLNVKIQTAGVRYTILREKENREGFANDYYWVWDCNNWNPLGENTLDLHDSFKISGWRTFEDIDAMLSGHKYKIKTETILELNNIGDNINNAYFLMNDGNTITGDWGGDLAKVAVVYGLGRFERIQSTYGFDFIDTRRFTSEELLDVTGLPGSEVTINYNGETKIYPYVSIMYNYGDYYIPDFAVKYKGKQVNLNNKSRRSINPGSTDVCTINGETYYIYFHSLGEVDFFRYE